MSRLSAGDAPTAVSSRSSSMEKVPQLVGQLNADGTATLRADTLLLPQGGLDHPPRSLKMALDAAAHTRRRYSTGDTPSEISSEEDYDAMQHDPGTILPGGKGGGVEVDASRPTTPLVNGAKTYEDLQIPSKKRPGVTRLKSIPVTLNKLKEKGKYILTADDGALREILRAGVEREKDPASAKKKRGKFKNLVFTRQFTTFDRNNSESASSPFHGFFTLFWLGMGIYCLKLIMANWEEYGNILGSAEIIKIMIHRDLIVLALSDGAMWATTGFSFLLQKLILKGYLTWNRTGWIIQSFWELIYIGAVIYWTLFREWAWTHTVFFVLHGIVMLMKQHSYAFYNGYLSEEYHTKIKLEKKLKQLENVEPSETPSATPKFSAISTSYLDHRPTPSDLNERRQHERGNSFGDSSNIQQVAAAIDAGEPLDLDQIHVFERIIKWEIDALTETLKGKSTDGSNSYPKSLNFFNHYEYTVLPTLVYELEYPRSDKINWWYVIEKSIAVFGILVIMNLVSQTFIYPVVVKTLEWKEIGMPVQERLRHFPAMLSELVFPFMMEYMMTWYLIWECILNILAELTFFADRGFYADWWNSVSWDQFARDWNRPVHVFLLRHVYHSSISTLKVNKHAATIITFFLSAVVHELVMWCLFKSLRGYLLFFQMMQLPLVQLSRTKFLRTRPNLGNFIFWLGIFTGPSLLCSLYLVLIVTLASSYFKTLLLSGKIYHPQINLNLLRAAPETLNALLDWTTRHKGVVGEDMEQPTPESEKKEKVERSYLSAAVESISPWGGSRSNTPKLKEGNGGLRSGGADHVTQRWHRLSDKAYPPDCPALSAKWFYAVDIPKRKPKLIKNKQEETKPPPPPKKFVPFSDHDSRRVEAAYLKLSEEYNDSSRSRANSGEYMGDASSAGNKPNTSMHEAGQDEQAGGKVRVPVHEDFLFDVDIEERELSPVYWLGPIYQVLRGTWFYQEGSTLRPCEENLAAQLEEGYLKVKPFRYPKSQEKPSSRPSSMRPGDDPKSLALSGAFSRSRAGSQEVTPKSSMENLKMANAQALDAAEKSMKDSPTPSPFQPQTYRLFGTWMNSVVTYQDSTVAWLSADSIMSRVSSTVYQKFAGGGYLGGIKLVRGYSEPGKSRDSGSDTSKPPSTPTTAAMKPTNVPPELQLDERQQKLLKRRSAPAGSTPTSVKRKQEEDVQSELPSFSGPIDEDMEAEAVRRRDEKEIQNDYNDRDGEDQEREIEHLILVTHGIGQKLGMRTESVNFVHDVNVLRQTLKSVYSSSADLQALNSEIDKLPKNCRIQVLPVCWRHLLDFPKKGVRQSRKEHDLGDAFGDEEEYPSLEDITVEGIPFVRSLITDLALDILLYQSAYREHISGIVLAESNRIYNLFRERNPDFNGKVSLVGHSLGSAIMFDILCRQKETLIPHPVYGSHGSLPIGKTQNKRHGISSKPQPNDLEFEFEVEDYYCLGSPVGLFQMLKGRNISARHFREDAIPAESPMDPEYMQDPFLGASSGFPSGDSISTITGLPLTLSSPKVAQLYNIFHPSDPIAYRLEPLITPAMSSMKPQPLPYTKKTISASVSGIGAKVGQSVSGLWSSLSSGIASSLLNRSLGLTNDDVARMGEMPSSSRTSSVSLGAGTNISAGGVITSENIPPTSLQREDSNLKKKQLAESTAAADRDGSGANAGTLIDDEIETLYSGFQKTRKGNGTGNEEWSVVEERGKKLRREESKVRALNGNGRVDYSIQESVLDFNPMNTIASHLSYWGDEDVSHFIMSQLLSRHRNSKLNTNADADQQSQTKR